MTDVICKWQLLGGSSGLDDDQEAYWRTQTGLGRIIEPRHWRPSAPSRYCYEHPSTEPDQRRAVAYRHTNRRQILQNRIKPSVRQGFYVSIQITASCATAPSGHSQWLIARPMDARAKRHLGNDMSEQRHQRLQAQTGIGKFGDPILGVEPLNACMYTSNQTVDR